MIAKIGHRGASGYVLENTLESIQKAIELGIDAIELDVHTCASGEVVVFHDFTLDRLTTTIGPTADFTLSELKQLKLNNEYTIPTLKEVLEFTRNKCWLNIELKGTETALPVFEILSSLDYNTENIIISSFQIDELKLFSNLNKKFSLAVLTQASIEQAIEIAVEIQAKAIHPHFSLLTEESCKKAKDLGLQINTWTVNEKSDIEHVKRFPIDGIISDFPDRI